MLRLILASTLGAALPLALPAPKTLPKTPAKNLKFPTKLATVDLTWGAGDRANVVAFLLDGSDRPLAGRRVRFQLQSWRGETVRTCSGTTDSKGRAQCMIAVPGERSANFTLLATFSGERLLRSSRAEGSVKTQAPLFRGDLQFSGGPTVEMSDVVARYGKWARLRARVVQGSTPVRAGRVRFFANGTPIGSGTVDAAGIATMQWRPRTRQTGTYRQLTGEHPRKMGAIQAVFEPAAGSRPSVAVAAAEVFPALSTCEAIGGRFCESAQASGQRVTVERRGRIRVRRHSFGRSTLMREPEIRMSVAAPPEPSSTFTCDSRHVGVPGFCDTSCTRLEYAILSPLGDMDALVGVDLDACTQPFDQEVEVAQRAAEIGWDACAAREAGRGSWGGTVQVSVPVRVGARFAFRDPSTKKTKSGWKANLRVKHRIREFTVNVPVDVECR